MVGTAHGVSLSSLMKNPVLVPLVGGIGPVILSDAEAKRRGVTQKTILERKESIHLYVGIILKGAPTFGIVIELVSAKKWVIHSDVGKVVDAMLANTNYTLETRWKEKGEFRVRFDTRNANATSMSSWFESLKQTYLEDVK
jgi:hypothetical protein